MTPKPDELEPCVCGCTETRATHGSAVNPYGTRSCGNRLCQIYVVGRTQAEADAMWNAAQRVLKGSGMTRETADSILDLMR